MSDQILIAAFSLIILCLGAILAYMFSFNYRLTKLETIFNFWIDTIGKKAAEILHSPNDHLGLDKYLEKYLGDHPTLSYGDFCEIKLMCEKVEKDVNIDAGKRLIAGFVA